MDKLKTVEECKLCGSRNFDRMSGEQYECYDCGKVFLSSSCPECPNYEDVEELTYAGQYTGEFRCELCNTEFQPERTFRIGEPKECIHCGSDEIHHDYLKKWVCEDCDKEFSADDVPASTECDDDDEPQCPNCGETGKIEEIVIGDLATGEYKCTKCHSLFQKSDVCVHCGSKLGPSTECGADTELEKKFRTKAVELYAWEDHNIDADAKVSIGENHEGNPTAWVQAWVFVSHDDMCPEEVTS